MSRVCPPCARPVRDGYLCHVCSKHLADTIRSTPLWADQLGLVLGRLTRYAEPVGSRGRETPVFFNPAASESARRLDSVLRRTARTLGADANVTTARLGVVAAWLAHNIGDLRKHPLAPAMEAAIGTAVERAIAVCDRPPEQWYAGPCPDCGKELYPSAAEKIVTCPCGRTWTVEDKRAELLARVRDVVAPGPLIARGLSGISTKPLSEELLRKWRHKGWLEPQGMTTGPRPANKYRVGDVLDLMTTPPRQRSNR